MKLKHFAVFGGIFTVIICLLLFLFIVTADDEESGASNFDFSGLNLSQEELSACDYAGGIWRHWHDRRYASQ